MVHISKHERLHHTEFAKGRHPASGYKIRQGRLKEAARTVPVQEMEVFQQC